MKHMTVNGEIRVVCIFKTDGSFKSAGVYFKGSIDFVSGDIRETNSGCRWFFSECRERRRGACGRAVGIGGDKSIVINSSGE